MRTRGEGATLYRKDMTVLQSNPAISGWRNIKDLPAGKPPFNRLSMICVASPEAAAPDPRLPGANWRQALGAAAAKISHPALIVR